MQQSFRSVATGRLLESSRVSKTRQALLVPNEGEKKIFVPADAPIVTYVPGDKADLKPGTKVFILRALAFAAIASAI